MVPQKLQQILDRLYAPIIHDWESKKDHPIDGKLRDNWQAAQAKIMGMKPVGLFNDARMIALRMERDATDDPKTYLKGEQTLKFIPKYWATVLQLAKTLSMLPTTIKRHILSLDQATVLPGHGSNQGGGGAPGGDPMGGGGMPPPGGGMPPPGGPMGGGAPPPAAASGGPVMSKTFNLSKMRRSGGNSMFLTREDEDKRYRMRGTLVGKLVRGGLVYMKPDGSPATLKADGVEELLVSRGGRLAQEAIKIEEELPGVVQRTIAEFFREYGITDGTAIARAIVSDAATSGVIDLKPCIMAIGGPRLLFLLDAGVEGLMEPEEIQALRESIGQAMQPYVKRLFSAMQESGTSVTEKKAPAARYTRASQRQPQKLPPDRDPESSSRVLDADEISSSADGRSLIMTAVNQDTDDKAKAAALDRAMWLLCRFPDFFKARMGDISASDVAISAARFATNSAIRRKFNRLGRMMHILDSDDAAVMSEYSSDQADRHLIAELVGSQKREAIIDSNPDMCIQKSGLGSKLAEAFFSKINPNDAAGLGAIKQAVNLWANGQLSVRDRDAFENAVMRATASTSDPELVNLCAQAGGRLAAMAVLIMVEENKDVAQLAPSILSDSLSDRQIDAALRRDLAIALVKRGSDDEMRIVWKAHKLSPMEIGHFLGMPYEQAYMRANRIDQEGDPVPDAASISSLPEDPLPLAKTLAAIGDHEAMLKLLQMCSSTLSAGQDDRVQYAAKFLMDTLNLAGKQTDVYNLFMPQWAVEASLIPGGWLMTKKAGSYSVLLKSGERIAFASNSKEAVPTALRLIAAKEGI